MAEPYAVAWDADRGAVVAEGDVDAAGSRGFAGALLAAADRAPAGALRVEMEDLELVDGVSVARAVTAVRAIRASRAGLALVGAPQMLAHTLYKVGLLGAITLESPRSDEGTTAN